MAIKIPSVKSTKLIVPEVNEVTYPDGIVIKVTGPNNATTRKPLYLAAYELANSVVKPTEPVIVPTKKVFNLSASELSNIKNPEPGDKFIINPGVGNSGLYLENFNAVTIDLSNYQFKDFKSSAIQLVGDCSGLIIDGNGKGGFLNTGSCIEYDLRDLVYNSNKGSYIDGIKLSGLIAENTSQMFTTRGGGFQSNGYIKGVIKNFQFVNNVIKNSPNIGEVIWAAYLEDFLIIGNVMDKLNNASRTHNGIFSVYGGNGRLTKNKLTNHQGDMIRCQPSQLTSGKGIEIDNNIVFESLMYSAFETKVDNDTILNKAFKPVDVNVHNNTFGRLSTLKDREGQGLDFYNLGGGKAKFDFNLGFELFAFSSDGITKMINFNYDPNLVEVGLNNVYRSKMSEAVNSDFSSKFVGVGATI